MSAAYEIDSALTNTELVLRVCSSAAVQAVVEMPERSDGVKQLTFAVYELGLRMCAVRKFSPRPSLVSR